MTREASIARGDEVLIRPMAAGDAAVVADLCGQLGYPSDAASMARRIAALDGRDDHGLLVAVDGDELVVGWVHVCVAMLIEIDPVAEIWGMVVAESCRGRGIGQRLMDEAERWAGERGMRTMRLRSRLQREEAHRFYQRLGYEIAKTSYTFRKELATAPDR